MSESLMNCPAEVRHRRHRLEPGDHAHMPGGGLLLVPGHGGGAGDNIYEKRVHPVAALWNWTHSPHEPGPRTASQSRVKNMKSADRL